MIIKNTQPFQEHTFFYLLRIQTVVNFSELYENEVKKKLKWFDPAYTNRVSKADLFTIDCFEKEMPNQL